MNISETDSKDLKESTDSKDLKESTDSKNSKNSKDLKNSEDSKKKPGIVSVIITAVHGFLMAVADSVPGVSGGTIAFLLGFYDKFIGSIDNLFKGKKAVKIEALKYLINLGVGWAAGMGAAVAVLSAVFENRIYEISSLFLGFIIAAIPVMAYEERECLKKLRNMLFLIPGCALVIFISIVGAGNNIDVSSMNIWTCLFAVAAGMAAISAMVLPGISGSTILLTFGLYIPAIGAVKKLLTFDFSGALLVACLAVGALSGVILAARIIRKSLENHRGATLYTVIGMMTGSLYAIVMGPTTLTEPKDPMNFSTFCIIPFLIGVALVAGSKIYSELKKKNFSLRRF